MSGKQVCWLSGGLCVVGLAAGTSLAQEVSFEPTVVIETVIVGNPGNADDTNGDGYGSVGYVYRIGKYEVTAGEYSVFLNAVAATDTYELYSNFMGYESYGCMITQNGTSGSYTYDFSARPSGTTVETWANRPVNFVSWGDAARFANWLHNGQRTGDQNRYTTEKGSYNLEGAMSGDELMAINREPDATWVIPSEDEWYKAAFHRNDGVSGNYFRFPTSTDSFPFNRRMNPDPGQQRDVLGGRLHGR